MLREQVNVSANKKTQAAPPAYAIAAHKNNEDIVAVRAGKKIERGVFLRDVAALAARLPDRKYILNLCTDRYHFMVGFAAALCRKQVSLLPSADAPDVLKAVAEDYPDLYALVDTSIDHSSFPNIVYPDDLGNARKISHVPVVNGDQLALILFTSGSTGRPTPVPKSWGVLVRSALAAGDRLGISQLGRATLFGTVPHQHSYGLESTILLGLQHGLIVDASSLFYPSDIRSAISASPQPRILVTTPVHLRTLVAGSEAMPQVNLILSATAPLPLPLAAKSEECFSAPLIEIYGCTEAGQVATRRTVKEASWHCLEGVILNQDGGTWASGTSVEGTVLLHDVIDQKADGTFLLGGRSTDLVNVAGKRTSLAHLNHHLLSIDGVADGVCFMQNQDNSQIVRVAALVVAPELRPAEILQALRKRIDAAFLPRPLILVDALPRNALGKLPRDTLIRLLQRDVGV